MAITGNFELKVEPSVLKSKAMEVDRLAGNMERHFRQMEGYINSTRNMWIGEAGDLHRSLYDQQKEKIYEMLQRLKEHPRDLMMMAGVYEEAENTNEEAASLLRGDVIV